MQGRSLSRYCGYSERTLFRFSLVDLATGKTASVDLQQVIYTQEDQTRLATEKAKIKTKTRPCLPPKEVALYLPYQGEKGKTKPKKYGHKVCFDDLYDQYLVQTFTEQGIKYLLFPRCQTTLGTVQTQKNTTPPTQQYVQNEFLCTVICQNFTNPVGASTPSTPNSAS